MGIDLSRMFGAGLPVSDCQSYDYEPIVVQPQPQLLPIWLSYFQPHL